VKHKAIKSIIAMAAVALVVGVALYCVGGKNSQTAQAGSGATTETAAAAAGARVLPTDPKLKVEPK
jgi:high-affinity Fe2+/Pb2+ permease